ncbi:competence protein ComEA [Thioalkalivibrio denitrificans]|uniref:Competence protein ComEA n=2 Tax=Thioalkalivibrio denitrificans TaxID=108003 RepID=A0A1V3NK23_9GAMM|nr:competence protein ComEA [Thioalkalivibrio denitrificans]
MKQYLSAVLIVMFLLLSAPALAEPAGSVNVNTADVEALTILRGVGPSRAEAIIAYREANGPFRSLHELMQVPGIGERTLEENMDVIVLE